MSTSFVSGLALAAASMFLGPALAGAGDACDPHVISSDTTFPMRSQLRGQTGIVYVDVLVDENGRAQSVELKRSSGHRLLDRAATRSIVRNWVFDVSMCAPEDLPANHRVAVEYRASSD